MKESETDGVMITDADESSLAWASASQAYYEKDEPLVATMMGQVSATYGLIKTLENIQDVLELIATERVEWKGKMNG